MATASMSRDQQLVQDSADITAMAAASRSDSITVVSPYADEFVQNLNRRTKLMAENYQQILQTSKVYFHSFFVLLHARDKE